MRRGHIPVPKPVDDAAKKERGASRSRVVPLPERWRWIHAIPVIVLLCFFILWWFSHPGIIDIYSRFQQTMQAPFFILNCVCLDVVLDLGTLVLVHYRFPFQEPLSTFSSFVSFLVYTLVAKFSFCFYFFDG